MSSLDFTKRYKSINENISQYSNYILALEKLKIDASDGLFHIGSIPKLIDKTIVQSCYHSDIEKLNPKFKINIDPHFSHESSIIFEKKYNYIINNQRFQFNIIPQMFEYGVKIWSNDYGTSCYRIMNLESKLKNHFSKEFIEKLNDFAHPHLAKLIITSKKLHKSSYLTPRLKLLVNFK